MTSEVSGFKVFFQRIKAKNVETSPLKLRWDCFSSDIFLNMSYEVI